LTAEALEDSAQRIAEKGREALRERLREAFEEAAAAHADVLELDDEKLDQMIERATDRADGLQWRRALATVATEELGIGLGEALDHPAVARAQKIVGAPSYEEGLAAIAEGQPPAPGSGPPEVEEGGSEPAEEAEGFQVGVGVVHLDGLAELEGEGELELLFSEQGLEVIRAGDRTILVSFAWSELEDVGVQPVRGRMWRRRAPARVVVSAKGRQGTFEARDVEHEELTRRLAPAAAKIRADG
jgi:hypothetical protein